MAESGQAVAGEHAAANAREKYMQENIMRYNSNVAQSKKIEEANFARMKGQVARNEARAAQLGYYAQAGQSLMSNYGNG